MKPCTQHREGIALLAVGALSEPEGADIQVHLNVCPGCRHYSEQLNGLCHELAAAGQKAAELNPKGCLHQRVLDEISGARGPAIPAFDRWWGSVWRVAALVGAVGLIVLILVFRVGRQAELAQPAVAPPIPPPPSKSLAHVERVKAPTYSAYRTQASVSLEALDDLLTKQAARSSGPAEIYTLAGISEVEL